MPNQKIARFRHAVLLLILLSLVIVIFGFVKPIPQDPHFHAFADQVSLGKVPNWLNVFSNLPFLLVGIWGISRYSTLAIPKFKQAYLVLSIAVMAVSFGSAYYHWMPTTQSLLWDRLPIALAFMALFSIVLDARVFVSAKVSSLWPLVLAGLAATLYWAWSETQGTGDLRAYLFVQGVPILFIPLILFLYPSQHLHTWRLVAAVVLYGIAKLAEAKDEEIYQIGQYISGHSIKHILASMAVACIFWSVERKL